MPSQSAAADINTRMPELLAEHQGPLLRFVRAEVVGGDAGQRPAAPAMSEQSLHDEHGRHHLSGTCPIAKSKR